jgi:hypothetical protein
MKYIVTKQDETGYEEIFVFPSTVNHDCFAEGVHRMKTSLMACGDGYTVHQLLQVLLTVLCAKATAKRSI